jgi:hypothetical protein
MEKSEDEEERQSVCAAACSGAASGNDRVDVNDPRVGLKGGLYDAGEAATGIKHIVLVKKADAFQLGVSEADDPKVQKMLGQLGMRDTSKMPKPLQLVIAQLAFANSDLAFQGNHLFQGNFYGMNIYDISNPAKATIVTSMGALAVRAMCRCTKI